MSHTTKRKLGAVLAFLLLGLAVLSATGCGRKATEPMVICVLAPPQIVIIRNMAGDSVGTALTPTEICTISK